MVNEARMINEFEFRGRRTRQYLHRNHLIEIEDIQRKTDEEIEKELQERIQNIPEEETTPETFPDQTIALEEIKEALRSLGDEELKEILQTIPKEHISGIFPEMEDEVIP